MPTVISVCVCFLILGLEMREGNILVRLLWSSDAGRKLDFVTVRNTLQESLACLFGCVECFPCATPFLTLLCVSGIAGMILDSVPGLGSV